MNKQPCFLTTIPLRCIGTIAATSALTLVLLLISGCATQATFTSPDNAVASLVAAAHAGDTGQLKNVLGSQADEVLSSGDDVADKNGRESFLKAYDQKHQLVAGDEGSITLVVGNSDWPLPIPIVRDGDKWRFDTDAGKEEILNRRIGRNELSTIQTCLAILDAQREYISHDRDANGLLEYATRFISTPGKKDGLFWPAAASEPPSPLGPLVAEAAEAGYLPAQRASGVRRPYQGYLFRILTRQGASAPGGALDYMVNGKLIGGFAIVAWPASYGNSGIMTFIMSHEGTIYQRDLGDGTAKAAEAMSAYDPSPQWKNVEQDK